MGFSRQEYWRGLPFPSPGDLHNPGTEPESPALQADSLPSEPPGHLMTLKNMSCKDFSTGPEVKISPSNARGAGSIPGRGAKMPHAL